MPAEPEASLRADLLQQISGAQAALEAQVELLRHAANLGGDSAALATAQHQLTRLGGLAQRIEHTSGAQLAAIRAEVNASVAASMLTAQQARSVAASGTAAETALHTASTAARQEVTSFLHDFYEEKKFDRYLQFASAEEEAAYRKREAERREAIDKALAEGTPQGNLRATDLSIAQLEDAGAHGADRSPEYGSTLSGLKGARRNLAAGIEQACPAARDTSTPAKADPLATDVGSASEIPPELLAAIKATGVALADQDQTGHGVERRLQQGSSPSRSA